MPSNTGAQHETGNFASDFYRRALQILNESQIRYLLGGAYMMHEYAGIDRNTKDLDIFVMPRDCERVLKRFAAAGYRTELTYSHWLGKIFSNGEYIDVIFSSGNGLCQVDREWFKYALDGMALGYAVKFCPPEEMIWQKVFVATRERFDAADVAHLLLARGDRLDWDRLLRRMGVYWRLLLSHLVLFDFIYPSERGQIPAWVLDELLNRFRMELACNPVTDRVCQGTLLSATDYVFDIESLGYLDARLTPWGNMIPEEIAAWTAGLQKGA